VIDILIHNFIYLQLIPAIVGLVVISQLKNTYKYYVILLWYAFFNEIAAFYYLEYISTNDSNQILYNLFNSISFGVLFWIFYKESLSTTLKRIIPFIALLYVFSIAFELIIQGKSYFEESQVIPYIIGGIGIIICVFQYFISILISDKTTNIYAKMLFWIAIAHFIYYIVFTPFKIGENYFSNTMFFDGYLNFKIGATVLKGILLSIGFIWSTRQKTT